MLMRFSANASAPRGGAGASLASGASATNLHLANHRDASACGQRVPKHARYTFISIDESFQWL